MIHRLTGIRVLLLGLFLTVAACSDSNEPGDATLTIDNQSGAVVGYVFFRECGESDWGEDQLGNTEVIEEGEERTWDITAGCYDIQAEYLNPGLEPEILPDNEIADGENFVWVIPALD